MHLKVKGQWVYLYRAVDKAGRAVDFLLSKRRDMDGAQRFFARAARQHGAPTVIELDGDAASHRAVARLKAAGRLPAWVQVRACKDLNNLVEQDHHRIKQRVLADARVQTIRDGGRNGPQHRTGGQNQKTPTQPQTLTGKATTVPEIWVAVLAA
jgi:transposase-like protein